MTGEQTTIRAIAAYLLSVAIGITGAAALAHFAACDAGFECLWSEP